MLTQIKHRYTGAVLFECDVPDTVESGLAVRHALEKAVAVGADLSSADLRSADLRSADLSSADLSFANLSSANLSSADLSFADLRSADLRSADLRSADLRSANLSSADLRSADLRSANLSFANLSSANLSFGKTVGDRPFFTIGPIGSRCALVQLWLTDKGPYVKAGCFTGTLEEFAAAVEKTHGESDHGKEYRMAILMMEAHAALWTPEAP